MRLFDHIRKKAKELDDFMQRNFRENVKQRKEEVVRYRTSIDNLRKEEKTPK